MIFKGETVDRKREVTFPLMDINNPLNPITGFNWATATGKLKIRAPGGALGNADVTRVAEIGGGVYVLQLTDAQVALAGSGVVIVDPSIAVAQSLTVEFDVLDPRDFESAETSGGGAGGGTPLPVGAVTLTGLIDIVRTRGDYLSSITFTPAYVAREIQAGWRELYELVADTHEGWWDKDSEIVTVPNQSYIGLPTDCWRVQAIDLTREIHPSTHASIAILVSTLAGDGGVPPATYGTLTITARAQGTGGNLIALANNGGAGPEPPTVTDGSNLVTLSYLTASSTIAEVAAAINASSALVSAAATGVTTLKIGANFVGALSGGGVPLATGWNPCWTPMRQVGFKDRLKFGNSYGQPDAFRTSVRGIELFKTPDQVYTLRVSYTPIVTSLDDTGIQLLGWEEYIIEAALLRLAEREEKPIGEHWKRLFDPEDGIKAQITRAASQRRASEPQYLNLYEGGGRSYEDPF